jgi:hypothetical protein
MKATVLAESFDISKFPSKSVYSLGHSADMGHVGIAPVSPVYP